MKKINDELTDFSIKSIIAKNQTSFNSFKNDNPNTNFSSLLNDDKENKAEDFQEQAEQTTVQEQILNQEAYLNRMVLETLAS